MIKQNYLMKSSPLQSGRTVYIMQWGQFSVHVCLFVTRVVIKICKQISDAAHSADSDCSGPRFDVSSGTLISSPTQRTNCEQKSKIIISSG